MEPVVDPQAVEEARHDYYANPETGSVIDALVKVAARRNERSPYNDAARDLFLYGAAIMTKTVSNQGMGDDTYPMTLDPSLSAIDQNGVLHIHINHHKYAEGLGLAMELQPDEFVMVTMGTDPLPTPRLIKGTLLMNHEGWVAAWKKAEKKLDEFLGR